MTGDRNPWPKWPLAVLILLAMGCATLSSDPAPPRVSLVTIRVQELRGFETAFEVDLRVMNRSDRPLTIQGLDCELKLSGSQLAEGVANAQTEIPPFDSGIVSVTVYSSMLDMVGIARRLMKVAGSGTGDEKLSYEIGGHVTAAGSGYSGRYPYNSKGEIDLDDLTGAP